MTVTQSLFQLSLADKAAGLEEARSKGKPPECRGPFPITPLASPPLPPHPPSSAPEEGAEISINTEPLQISIY